jgi:hypothetical protein
MRTRMIGARKKGVPRIDTLSVGDLLKAMTPAQLWAVCLAIGCSLVAVATLAFRLGQILANMDR